MTTGIICAMDVEAQRLRDGMQNGESRELSGISFVSGRLYGQDVVVAVCGIGKVFAAVCAQTMILHYRPGCIINTGVAGSLSDDLRIGDIVIADQVVQHDMDTSPLGDPVGNISGINKVFLPGSERIVERLKRSVESIGLHARVGTIASGDQFISDAKRKAAIADTFGAIACEMEGAAIGQVCHINGVEFCVLRAISDGADEGSHMDYHSFVQLAAKNSCKVLEAYLSSLQE